jgi:hypothetical protein
MSDITLKELNFARTRGWLIDAEGRRQADPVYSFIAAWISFNHFYGTYASSNVADFDAWSNTNASGSRGDKAQWRFLVQTKQFTQFFDAFKANDEMLFSVQLQLPVMDILTGKAVPDGLTGTYKCADLNTEQLFALVYQIRNNLFHGDKDPFSSERDTLLSSFASNLMLPLVSALVSATYGEVLNAYDKKQHEEIAKVAAIR